MHSFAHLVVLVALLLPHQGVLPQEESDVGFPEREHLDIERNKTRIPLYIPGKCKLNQLLYPGDQKTDWVCDCKPGYLYYAPMDGCFEAYRQGPCAVNMYLTLATGEFSPKCTVNPCNQDDMAPYPEDGKCYRLHTPGPCDLKGGQGIFGVNTATLRLECIKGADRISMIRPYPLVKKCLPGQTTNTHLCKPLQ